jgi:hypothetical protein
MPEPWPQDAESAVTLLSLIVRQIDRRSEKEHQELLADFLFASWPSFKAQDQ